MRSVPHFSVTTVDGVAVRYTTLWQQRQLVLILLPPGHEAEHTSYTAGLKHALAGASDTALVITSDPVAGITAPAAVVADRWGEIVHIEQIAHVRDLPPPAELVAWVEHLSQRCPECEGESR